MVGWVFHPTYNERNDIMYIEPNSTLYILKNVPLDTTYDHTLWFDTAAEQAQYFSGLAKYRLSYQNGTALTYVRVNRGTIKVPFKADALYDCNYIMFRNNGFGDKWFYAFIRSVEYVNNTTAEIAFELDVMQTWHFDYSIDQCFVEREHSVTDDYAENTIPEDVPLGDYVSTGLFGIDAFTNWSIVVVTSCKLNALTPLVTQVADPVFINGTYQQLNYNIFSPTAESAQAITGMLNSLATYGKEDLVVGMYLVPSSFVAPRRSNLEDSLGDGLRAYNTVCKIPTNLDCGKYTPKNKKLLTYPYTFLTCTNFEGADKKYKFEYFRQADGTAFPLGGDVNFMVYSDTNVRPTALIAPDNYLSYFPGEAHQANLNEAICVTNFPICQFTTTDAGAKFVQALIGVALTGIAGTPRETTTSTMEFKKARYEGMLEPSRNFSRVSTSTGGENPGREIASSLSGFVMSQGSKSVSGTGNIMQSALATLPDMKGGIGFGFRILSIRSEYARIIDDYFSCYGYATKRVKTPNRNSRPHWNYVKTIGCTIKGSIPCDDMARVCNIYNNGITFWKHGDEVGNYSLDNSPA